jgi:hypothetical protein
VAPKKTKASEPSVFIDSFLYVCAGLARFPGPAILTHRLVRLPHNIHR